MTNNMALTNKQSAMFFLLLPNLGAVDLVTRLKKICPPSLEEFFSSIAEAGSHMMLPLLPPFSSSMGEMAHHPFASKAFASQTKWAVKLDVSSPQSIIVLHQHRVVSELL